VSIRRSVPEKGVVMRRPLLPRVDQRIVEQFVRPGAGHHERNTRQPRTSPPIGLTRRHRALGLATRRYEHAKHEAEYRENPRPATSSFANRAEWPHPRLRTRSFNGVAPNPKCSRIRFSKNRRNCGESSRFANNVNVGGSVAPCVAYSTRDSRPG
jgi:hypothetical protein